MKFVVTHGPLNEVDVRLAYESKKKIKKIVYRTALGIEIVVVGFWYGSRIARNNEAKNAE